jgi:glutathione S-transferase
MHFAAIPPIRDRMERTPQLRYELSMTRTILYSGPLSMFGAKAEIALLEKGVAFDLVMVPFDKNDRYEPRHPEVLRLNPKRQVPVLTNGDLELFDSTLIFEFLEDAFPDPPLWPSDVNARARARLLELKCDDVVFMNIARLFGLEDKPGDPIAIDARATAHQHYAEMDAQLEGQDFLAGPFSYADIALFMAQFYGERKGAMLTKSTPRLLEWRKRVLQRPAIRKVIGRMGAWLKSEGRDSPVYIEDAVMGRA